MARDYDELASIHGDSPLSLGWGLKDRREIRFNVLTENWLLEDSSVLDLGCGFGDLYGYITDKNFEISYLGLDSSRIILDIAEKKYPSANFELFDLNSLATENRKFDYIFASGIFNDARPEAFDFINSVFLEAKRLSTRGFSFNFLSSAATIRHNENYYASASEIARICEKNSLKYVLNHSYMPFEFTIHVDMKQEFDQSKVIFDDYFKHPRRKL